ncbi:MAG: hypothetical protein LBS27_02230 [Bifidobacteriaceae bacterium]|jgi:hypothetical protein|nr:hypothetical protein [Bifidobacteriaceae bacterium]
MKDMIDRYVGFVERLHKVVVLAGIALLALSLAVASRLTVDSSMEGMLPQDNAVVAAMRQMEDEFGNQDAVAVAARDPASGRGSRLRWQSGGRPPPPATATRAWPQSRQLLVSFSLRAAKASSEASVPSPSDRSER